MKFYIAPVQGHTDAAWRHFHTRFFNSGAPSFTPFIRLEQNSLRPRDLKDFKSELNEGAEVIPQIIFRDANELSTLVRLLKDNGASKIDLNMGCPFPLQTGHGRGAATITNEELGHAVESLVTENPDITFSLKMRLGMNDKEEWKKLLPHLNRINLSHITLHPRIARQQYSGEVDYEQFGKFLSQSINPVVYNGDLKTPDEIDAIMQRFPEIKGIMLGRGLLGRPSLINEMRETTPRSKQQRLADMIEFHRSLMNYYSETLCGESQIISKIKPFWEYAEDEIGRKAWKSIKKSVNLAKYNSAVALINPNSL